MSVNFVLNQRVNPRDVTAPRKYYAQAKSKDEQTTRQLATEISKRSGLSVADVMAVIESFIDLIPEKIAEGYIVRLGDFGSFNLSLSSDGVDKIEDFTPAMIRDNSLNFRPGKVVQGVFNNIEYKRISE
jgi:predicted histone-like DNA-binding protein